MPASVPGEILILLAFAFNLTAGVSFVIEAFRPRGLGSLAIRAYYLLTVVVIAAAAWLIYLFLTHDFSVKYVFQYSDRALGFFYTLSALWAGQEGTYLLWLLLSVAFGYILYRRAGIYRDRAMAVLAVVNAWFLFILIDLSPFAPMDSLRTDGAGLNPLLQNPWMVIHPPIMFTGYAMAALPFCIVIAALWLGNFTEWVRRAMPWMAATAVLLAAGNVLGGYWAYQTLGWGGYWAWDPVENSSFVPWLVSLAALHGLVIQQRTGSLAKINLLLVALTFLLVVYGTFLTRSGVLADFSVHSFVDLGTHVYLVAFLVLFVLLTLALFAWRAKSIEHIPLNYNFWGREFSLVAATALLFVLSVVVLFWTSLPVLTSAFSSQPRAADASTYNDFAMPLAMLFAFFLTVTQATSYSVFQLPFWRSRLMIVASASVVVAVAMYGLIPKADLAFAVTFASVAAGLTMHLLRPGAARLLLPSLIAAVVAAALSVGLGVTKPTYVLFFALGAMATVGGLSAAIKYLPDRWRLAGGALAHTGFGVMLIGILASSGFTVHQKLVLKTGASGEAFGRTITYKGMAGDFMEPDNELILTVGDSVSSREIRPQLYYSQRMDGVMRRPQVMSNFLYDLYFAPEQVTPPDEQTGIKLTKGEPQQAGLFTLTFDGFEMGEHASGGPVRVAARVIVEHQGKIDTLYPSVATRVDSSGQSDLDSYPDRIGTEGQEVILQRVLADEGAVIVHLPGVTEPVEAGTLAIDVSRKLLISLVWIGTILILTGAALAFLRRLREVPA